MIRAFLRWRNKACGSVIDCQLFSSVMSETCNNNVIMLIYMLAFDYINNPGRLTIHCMEYVVDFAVLGSCKGRGLVYTTIPPASRLFTSSATTRYVVIPSTVVVFLSFELTSVSRGLFGRLYAINGGS